MSWRELRASIWAPLNQDRPNVFLLTLIEGKVYSYNVLSQQSVEISLQVSALDFVPPIRYFDNAYMPQASTRLNIRPDASYARFDNDNIVVFGGVREDFVFTDTLMIDVVNNTVSLVEVVPPMPSILTPEPLCISVQTNTACETSSRYSDRVDRVQFSMDSIEVSTGGQATVYLFGGRRVDYGLEQDDEAQQFVLDTLYSFDGTWSQIEARPHPPHRYGHAHTAIGDSLIIAGGKNYKNADLTDVWKYRGGRWEQLGSSVPVGTITLYTLSQNTIPSNNVEYGDITDTRWSCARTNKRLEASGQCAATENALCEYDSNGICNGDCHDQDANGVCDKYNNTAPCDAGVDVNKDGLCDITFPYGALSMNRDMSSITLWSVSSTGESMKVSVDGGNEVDLTSGSTATLSFNSGTVDHTYTVRQACPERNDTLCPK